MRTEKLSAESCLLHGEILGEAAPKQKVILRGSEFRCVGLSEWLRLVRRTLSNKLHWRSKHRKGRPPA